ncbi:MAG TPA: ribonuclease H [Ktedonobacteraceae bacterium]|nr:ribonuclease H [Ktedonobacteraceae bacterium]
MNQVDESLEWRSVIDALRTIYVETARSTLGTQGVIAYTDGACLKNPGGPAGWSAILLAASDVANNEAVEGAKRIECYGHIPKAPTTTNNRSEITAVLAVLSIAPPDAPLTIYSDSEYTIKVAQGTYQMKANPDLWALYRMLLKHRKSAITFQWVRGHSGHDLNERADELAGLGAFNNDQEAYRQWQESMAPEARNLPSSAELTTLRQQVQKLKALFDTISIDSPRVGASERSFIDDMAKRLQKNNFSPSPKQSNWVKGLVAKYKV